MIAAIDVVADLEPRSEDLNMEAGLHFSESAMIPRALAAAPAALSAYEAWLQPTESEASFSSTASEASSFRILFMYTHISFCVFINGDFVWENWH